MATIPNVGPSRRELLVWFATIGFFGSSSRVAASGGNELDPTDRIQRHFSVKRFTALSRNEIYMVNLAVRQGRRITIDGFSPSESRRIIGEAAKDWPTTRSWLLSIKN